MAAGPSGPTISVSTSPISVHPISARMTGTARAIMGLSSRRMPDNIDGIISQQGQGPRARGSRAHTGMQPQATAESQPSPESRVPSPSPYRIRAMSKLAAYAGVARAPFLLLPVTLVASGAAAAAYDDRAFVPATVLAVIGLVALHAAVNAFNEASDMRSGIDLQTTRTPFSGGSGTLPSGALSVGGAVGVGVAGSIVGLLIGIYFGTQIGWWPLGGVMAIGAVAVLDLYGGIRAVGCRRDLRGAGPGASPGCGHRPRAARRRRTGRLGRRRARVPDDVQPAAPERVPRREGRPRRGAA